MSRTEELLGATALLDDLHQTGLQLLNGWDVVGEDTHLSGLGGDVNLDAVDKDSVRRSSSWRPTITMPTAGRVSSKHTHRSICK
jgi:hypothetical protein